jgi:hypothetical protein
MTTAPVEQALLTDVHLIGYPSCCYGNVARIVSLITV